MSSLQSRAAPQLLLLALTPGLLFPPPALAQPLTDRVSVGTGGIQANHPSGGPAVSDDGRWVAFDSSASNLAPGDANDTADVFLHDRQTATTVRVSVGPGGVEGNGLSRSPAISADGRWVAFVSFASTLVGDDANHAADVFMYDRLNGTVARVSTGLDGVGADMDSDDPAISADGRWVTFSSLATNLVAGDLNAQRDVFLHDRQTGTTTRVSTGLGGVESNAGSGWPAISADGRWVAFNSAADNLVPVDVNGHADTFVHDRLTGTTVMVSVGPGGVQGDDMSWGRPSISADGMRVAFQSAASTLVPGDTNGEHDVFVHDRASGVTRRVSVGPGGAEGDSWSEFPTISADGRWVVFDSSAAMVANDENHMADVFAFDLTTDTMTRVSQGLAGAPGNGGSYFQSVTADGRWVVFMSWASNLVAGDSNGYGDIFVRDMVATTPLPPGDLVVHAVAGPLVTLRWTSPGFGPAPTNFVIEGGTAPGEVLASVPTGSTAPTFTVAAPPGSFYVRVHTQSGAFRSTPSNEVLVHVNTAVPPSAPAYLQAVVDGTRVTLAWRNTYGGGAPTSLELDVTGSATVQLPLGLGDTFTFTDVPPGRYTLTLRARNASGVSSASNAVSLSVPGPCSGPPATPVWVFAYLANETVHVAWQPGVSGPAPAAYVVIVTGGWTGALVTTVRETSGVLGAGAYTLSLVAVNSGGASGASPPRTVMVP